MCLLIGLCSCVVCVCWQMCCVCYLFVSGVGEISITVGRGFENTVQEWEKSRKEQQTVTTATATTDCSTLSHPAAVHKKRKQGSFQTIWMSISTSNTYTMKDKRACKILQEKIRCQWLGNCSAQLCLIGPADCNHCNCNPELSQNLCQNCMTFTRFTKQNAVDIVAVTVCSSYRCL